MAGPKGIGGSPRRPMNQQRLGLVQPIDLAPSLKSFLGDFKGQLPTGFLNNISQAAVKIVTAEVTSPGAAYYEVQPTDFILLVDCSNGPMTLFLPPTTGEATVLIVFTINADADSFCTILPNYGSTDEIFGAQQIEIDFANEGVLLFSGPNPTSPSIGNAWFYFFQQLPSNQPAFFAGTDTGAADAWVVDVDDGPSSLVAGLTVAFVVGDTSPGNSSSGNPATFNFNNTGAISVYQMTSNVNPDFDQLKAGYPAILTYDGTYWRIISPSLSGQDGLHYTRAMMLMRGF